MISLSIKIGITTLCAIISTGCSSIIVGHLYTNTTQPYSTDFNKTHIGSKRCIITHDRIKEPLTGYGVSAEWGKHTLDKAARKAGITHINYAEIKTLSFLRNAYRRKTIIIYGD